MYTKRKFNSKYFLAIISCLIIVLLTLQLPAIGKNGNIFLKALTVSEDTTVPTKPAKPQNFENKLKADTSKLTKDSGKVLVIDTLKFSKDSLDAPIKYVAQDSGVLQIADKKFILYGKATIDYKDINVKAGTINYNSANQLMSAYGGTDTSKGALNKAEITQGGSKSISDSIFFNMQNQRGLTKNTFYQEGEIYVNAQKIKKVDADVEYAYKARFTTCNLDTPHFAFRARKMKLINNKVGISGPAGAEIEGVPLPVGIPFGIYPLNQGRHSGFLPPQFATNEDFGLGLEGLGFYKVLNENTDVTIRTNVYTYGGWNLFITPRYMKRYKYTGSFSLSIQNTKILNRGNSAIKQEFIESKNFLINWNHTRDNRARPGTNFSASVNAGSTKFNSYIPNNATANFNNQLSSSINYSKTWNNKFNLSVSANHSQNNQSRLVNLNLPTVNFNVITVYPFEKKEKTGTPKWYEKLGVGLSTNVQNQASFYDSAANLRRILDTTQWGVMHNIPITLSLPSLGPIIIAPNIGYQENWIGQKRTFIWNKTDKKLDTITQKGFFTARQMQFGLSGNTRIFGTYQFKKGNVKAIRHEIRPNFGLNYTPNMGGKYHYTTQVDTAGHVLTFSQYDGGIVGGFGNIAFGGMTFGVDNLLEMKVRSKKDTTAGATKKIRLIDGFGFNSSYNFLADSFQLNDFNLYLRSNLFDKINITATTLLSPYQTDSAGFIKKQYAWQGNKFSLGRITSGSIAMSTQFKSKTKDGKTDKERLPKDQFMTPEQQQAQLDYARQNPAEFTDFNIPWSISLSYAFNFINSFDATKAKYVITTSSSISATGDFSLSPKWKVGGNTYFDFKTKQIQSLSFFLTREMHCWQMAINVTPVGPFRSFNISISPKSGILRDLRINRNRFFYNQ
jgi:LPS-assembly protein